MWDASTVDQAGAYGKRLVERNKFSEVEKFNLLRGISLTVAGIKANGKVRTSKEELESIMLGFYHDRLVLDLKIHCAGIAANFDIDIMKKRVLGAPKKLSKRKKEALAKAESKAAKKNVAAADPENFSGLECHDLFLEIKYEANNTFNPIWVKSLNKNGDIPSGVQLSDLLDKIREEAFAVKDAQRRIYLVASRKRTAQKKLLKVGAAVSTENDSEESENEVEEGQDEKKNDKNPKKISANSPSNAIKMPEDYLPTHFLSWLANGPAADSQHPLWLPDTSKAVVKVKADILDSTAASNSMGRSSVYSRKMQRGEHKNSTTDTVLDLTKGDEVSNVLLRESVKNSSKILALLKGVSDQERQNVDALVVNAERLYTLTQTEASKLAYISALEDQKELLQLRTLKPLEMKEEIDCKDLNDDFLFDGKSDLDYSFTHESVDTNTPSSV